MMGTVSQVALADFSRSLVIIISVDRTSLLGGKVYLVPKNAGDTNDYNY